MTDSASGPVRWLPMRPWVVVLISAVVSFAVSGSVAVVAHIDAGRRHALAAMLESGFVLTLSPVDEKAVSDFQRRASGARNLLDDSGRQALDKFASSAKSALEGAVHDSDLQKLLRAEYRKLRYEANRLLYPD